MSKQILLNLQEETYQALQSFGTDDSIESLIETLLRPYVHLTPEPKLREWKEVAATEDENGAPTEEFLTSRLSVQESELFAVINRGLSEAELWEYQGLLESRQGGCLSDVEHDRLLVLSDRLELLQADRLAALVELAHLRGVDLKVLMQALDFGFLVQASNVDD